MSETTLLAAYGLLVMLTILLQVLGATRQLSMGYLMSSRDETRTTTGMTARLGRALDNHFEGLILFGIAVGVVQMSAQNTAFTAACAWVYLIARLLYIPAYALGLRPHRSFIWIVGFAATMLMLLAALI